MVTLTKAQRRALKRIYDRTPLVHEGSEFRSAVMGDGYYLGLYPVTYREFRKEVKPAFGSVMVRWCGIWLGIEPDGYTHS